MLLGSTPREGQGRDKKQDWAEGEIELHFTLSLFPRGALGREQPLCVVPGWGVGALGQ